MIFIGRVSPSTVLSFLLLFLTSFCRVPSPSREFLLKRQRTTVSTLVKDTSYEGTWGIKRQNFRIKTSSCMRADGLNIKP